MSSILSGINVVSSLLMIWIKESKIKLPDQTFIHSFIIKTLPKILRVDSPDIRTAFVIKKDSLASWRTSDVSSNYLSCERPLENKIKPLSSNGFQPIQYAGKNLETTQERLGKVSSENSLEQQSELIKTELNSIRNILETEIKAIRSLLNEKFSENDSQEKAEKTLMATMLNRVFGILAVILNIGFLTYAIFCYVFIETVN